jgi:hypothetical protein
MPSRDPIKAWVRDARAQRRVGQGSACPCGELRPFALIAGHIPPICFACDRIAHGRAPYEDNHVFGKRNSEARVRVPINDHRAVLSVAQYEWPPDTLENPEGCPLLGAAARLRGRADMLKYMIDESRASAECLEKLCATTCKHGTTKPRPTAVPKKHANSGRRKKRD